MSLQESSVPEATALLEAGRAHAAFSAATAALDADPAEPLAWLTFGRAAQALGRFEDAAGAYARLDALWPGREGVLLARAQCLAEADRLGEAEAVLRRALALGAGAAAHANLGAVLARLEREEEACAHLHAALAIMPDLAAAHRNLAALLVRCDPVAALRHRDAAYRGRALRVREAAHPRRRVLVLCSAAGGNVPLRHLLPPADNTIAEWFVEYAASADQPPDCNAVFNAMGDADLAPEFPAPVRRLLAARGMRVLNPPEAVARTRRDRLPGALAGIEGVLVPRVVRHHAGGTPAGAEIRHPVLARPLASHGGEGVRLVHHVEALPESDAYLTEFVDFASPDGWFRKYRAIFVGGEVFAYHLAIARDWLVHYWTAGMAADAWRRAEEQRFLANPAATLGDAWAAVAAIARRLGLDYGGIDFTALPDGRVLVFEANATMLVHPEPTSMFAYRNDTVKRIRAAFEVMLGGARPVSAGLRP